MPPLIQTIDLVTRFHTYEGVVHALNRISLVIPRGCTFGLVGESGCGKSVFARSLMRIVQPPGRIEGGQILFYAEEDAPPVDLVRQSEAYMQALRGNRISMIFQEPNAALNPLMTIGEQVCESFLLHRKAELYQAAAERLAADAPASGLPLRKLYAQAARRSDSTWLKVLECRPLARLWHGPLRRAAEERVVELLGQLGIAHPGQVIRRYPHNLSGGMKQRVVIAMALACDPLLLIADEATSNLDVTIQAQILELLGELKRTRISAVLLITHDLGVVAETCDRVGVMYAGNLCEEAPVTSLYERPFHPYTRALLASVPKLSQTETLHSIEGAVPNLVQPPPGCRFHPRCPHAMPVCRQAFPDLVEMAAGHRVACYLYHPEKGIP